MTAAPGPPAAFADAWAVADSIHGWLTEPQAAMLYRLAAAVPADQAVVEIGSHRGRSTVVLAAARDGRGKVVAVDPFDDPRWGGGPQSLDAFRSNLERATAAGVVETYRGLSSDCADGWDGEKVGLAFIDGAHDYDSVVADIDGWSPFVPVGGHLALHDAFSSVGVTRAILRQLVISRRFTYVGSERSLAVYRREDPGVLRTIGSAVRQLPRLCWFLRNVAIKLALRGERPRLAALMGHHQETYPY